MIPSRINLDLSVNSVRDIKERILTHYCRSHWQNSTLLGWYCMHRPYIRCWQ